MPICFVRWRFTKRVVSGNERVHNSYRAGGRSEAGQRPGLDNSLPGREKADVSVLVGAGLWMARDLLGARHDPVRRGA